MVEKLFSNTHPLSLGRAPAPINSQLLQAPGFLSPRVIPSIPGGSTPAALGYSSSFMGVGVMPRPRCYWPQFIISWYTWATSQHGPFSLPRLTYCSLQSISTGHLSALAQVWLAPAFQPDDSTSWSTGQGAVAQNTMYMSPVHSWKTKLLGSIWAYWGQPGQLKSHKATQNYPRMFKVIQVQLKLHRDHWNWTDPIRLWPPWFGVLQFLWTSEVFSTGPWQSSNLINSIYGGSLFLKKK